MKNLKEIILIVAATFALAGGALAFLASQADGAVIDWSKADPNKILTVVGEVDETILVQAKKLNMLAGEPVIRILINSPGGNVITGNIFIQAMEDAKAKGSKIECLVTNLAASMGMHIFAHCDKRVVLSGGILLFHEARVVMQGAFTARELAARANTLNALTFYLEHYLIEELGCDPEFYRVHNEGETLWSAELFKKTFPDFDLIIVNGVGIPNKFAVPLFDPSSGKKEKDKPPVGSPLTFPIPLVS
jgi:ATP-dependent protease ClpP protease subunit